MPHVADDHVEIIDHKTDRGWLAHEEYRTQRTVYAHVVSTAYPDREVCAMIC